MPWKAIVLTGSMSVACQFAWEGFSKSIKFSEEYKYKSKPIKGNAKWKKTY
jgi:hypothetical protein